MKGLNLNENDLNLILSILKQYIPNEEVRVFGSRVNSTAKKFSDIDLVVMTKEPLSIDILGSLHDAFSASLLPIKVDIIDWSRIDEGFKKIILKKNIKIQ